MNSLTKLYRRIEAALLSSDSAEDEENEVDNLAWANGRRWADGDSDSATVDGSNDSGVSPESETDAVTDTNTGLDCCSAPPSKTETDPSSEEGNADDGTDPNDGDPMTDGGWTVADLSVEKTLHDVAWTKHGPFAVGAGGRMVQGTRDGWRLVFDTGPATKRNALTCIAASDDGERVWLAGSSGVLGMYDAAARRKYDFSAPGGKTSTWEAIAVTGSAGDERLRVANGSGEVLSATVDEHGCPTFGDVVKPDSGSTIAALDFGGDVCYAIDTSGNVFAETDGEWTDIGIRNAQVNFFDVEANKRRLLVAGGGGRVYRYDRPCRSWTPVDVGTGALRSIVSRDGQTVVAGADGQLHRRHEGSDWQLVESPVKTTLRGIALGPDGRGAAVGAGGAAIEQREGDKP